MNGRLLSDLVVAVVVFWFECLILSLLTIAALAIFGIVH